MAAMKLLAPGIIVILALLLRNKPHGNPAFTQNFSSINNLANVNQFSIGSDAALTILSRQQSQRSAILNRGSDAQLRFFLI